MQSRQMLIFFFLLLVILPNKMISNVKMEEVKFSRRFIPPKNSYKSIPFKIHCLKSD